jgi:AcrR family transcriptional regulator
MQTRSIETRKKIIQSARELFAQTGYESASVDDICRAAGISKGAFYHHFPSKQSVFMDLLEEWLIGIDQGLELLRSSQADAADGLVRMADILPEILKSAEGRLPIFLEFWEYAVRDPKLWQAAVEPYRHYREYFTHILSGMSLESAGAGEKEVAGLAVMSLAIGLVIQGILDPEAADWGSVGRESIRMLLGGMKNKSAVFASDPQSGKIIAEDRPILKER